MPPTANRPVRDGGSEHRILDALKRHGPRTAGELAALLGGGQVALRSCCARGDEVCRFDIGPVRGDARSGRGGEDRRSCSPGDVFESL